MSLRVGLPQEIRIPDRQPPLEALFRQLREEAAVVPVKLEDGLEAWVVTRYSEGLRVLRDPRFVKDLRQLAGPGHGLAGKRYAEDVFVVEGRHMLNSDGAEHQRLRGAATAQLSARAVVRRLPEMEQIAEGLTTALAVAASPDLMSDYARPMTELVMARVLGLPDQVMLPAARLNRRLGRRDDPMSAPMREAYTDLVDLIRESTKDRRAFARHTVIGALWEGIGAGRVNRRELVSTVMMLIGAGTSSTAIAIGQGAATLASTAGALRAMLDDDERATSVVEELLRRHPPFPFSPWRFAREAVDISGTTIPAGAVVFVLLAAANRDPAAVEEAESLIPDRESRATPLTFGHGPHYCVGAHLARLEIKVALRVLFRRLPDLRLAVPYPDLPWSGLLFDRTMTSLPVIIGAQAGAEASPVVPR